MDLLDPFHSVRRYVEDGSDSDAEAPILTLFSLRTPPPGSVCMNLANQEVMMEVDMGAAVSLMSAEQWFGLQLPHQMEPSNCSLRTCAREATATKGKVSVEVTHMKQRKILPLAIVEGMRPALFGRNWLNAIHLDW